MSNQQQPRQWFRFGSFFQAAQQPQPRPNPPRTTPTQQPATRPPVIQTRQKAPLPTPSQETPRPAGAPNEITIQRFPVTPRAAFPTPNPQPTQTGVSAVPQPRPLALQLAPRVETPPVPPTRPLGASNEATINRSVASPMPPSAPPQRFPQPLISTPMPRSPSKTTSATVPPLKLQPSDTTNASTPYSSPLSRTPPSMQTSPTKKASPGTDQAEQKSVLVQEKLDKSRVIPGKQDVYDQNTMETTKNKKGAKEKGKTSPKKPHDPEKSGTRLILAGINRGAVMDLTNTHKNVSPGFGGNGKKLGSVLHGGKEETSNPNMEDKTHKKGMSIQSSTTRAFINNNVQGFNNSIVFNSTCKEKDPGVHLRFARKDNFGREEILKKDQSK